MTGQDIATHAAPAVSDSRCVLQNARREYTHVTSPHSLRQPRKTMPSATPATIPPTPGTRNDHTHTHADTLPFLTRRGHAANVRGRTPETESNAVPPDPHFETRSLCYAVGQRKVQLFLLRFILHVVSTMLLAQDLFRGSPPSSSCLKALCRRISWPRRGHPQNSPALAPQRACLLRKELALRLQHLYPECVLLGQGAQPSDHLL